uniref:Uncharacterized protein n=1 Tax=Oryza sativa subsp. japonica TaxID=39947 RepID=Q8LHM6_ORYSJ|nr:hypothetical protein [Oryza sativa Japonica Group]
MPPHWDFGSERKKEIERRLAPRSVSTTRSGVHEHVEDAAAIVHGGGLGDSNEASTPPNTASRFAHSLVSDEKTSKVMPIPAAASAAVALLRPSPRREEEREESGKTKGEDNIWGPHRIAT